MPYFEKVFPALAFLFGLVIGSFLNVCIHRIPKGESVVAPRSHCPSCGHPIPWYENIPLLSYVILRRRCSACGARISPQYFLVELATGLLFAGLAANFGPGKELLKYAVFGSLVVALMIIDLRDRLLPDRLTFSGLLLGVAFSAVVILDDGSAAALTRRLGEWPPRLLSVLDALLGAAAGAVLLWIVAEGYRWWRKREGMGFGDVKFMAFAGAFLGIKLAFLTIFLGSVMGTVFGIPLWIYFILRRLGHEVHAKRRRPLRMRVHRTVVRTFRFTMSRVQIPFGVFLSMAAMLVTLWGKEIVRWYLSQFS